jgi:guanylate kinase
LIKQLLRSYPQHFEYSISYTTRQPRPLERHGIDYFFVEKKTFENVNLILKAGYKQ